MSPEEHFRRLQRDDVWSGDARPTRSAAPALPAARPRRDRGPIWVTAVVGAALVVVTVFATHATASTGRGAVGAPATAAGTTTPTPTSTPTPSDPRSTAASDPSLRIFEFDPRSAADMARARTILACFRHHGVRLVDLEPSGTPGIENIGFGGPDDDQGSITTGLRYSDECFAAGGTP